MSDPDPFSATEVLRRVSPAWYWVRQNFTLPAVLTIAGVMVSAAGYIISLRTRVIVLQTEVTHIVQVAPDRAALAAISQRVDDHEQRIARLEGDWDHAGQVGAQPVPRPNPWRRHRGER